MLSQEIVTLLESQISGNALMKRCDAESFHFQKNLYKIELNYNALWKSGFWEMKAGDSK